MTLPLELYGSLLDKPLKLHAQIVYLLNSFKLELILKAVSVHPLFNALILRTISIHEVEVVTHHFSVLY